MGWREAFTDEAESLALSSGDRQALEQLIECCPVYRDTLLRHPEWGLWLCKAENRQEVFRRSAFWREWRRFAPAAETPEDAWLLALQRFRRVQSMRIAFREVNGWSDVEDSIREQTLLAEVCVKALSSRVFQKWQKRLGAPWLEAEDRPCPWLIVALGKMGGEELNFCSDLDLVYVYEGPGVCQKDGRPTQLSHSEFFNRAFRDFSGLLHKRTAEGFLYNVDLRLRPEGDSGPLARTLAAMERYYYTAGQSWERLAWLRARCIAGDQALADQLFDHVQAFRYPRHYPPSLPAEIAGNKLRLEKEMAQAGSLPRDLKNGPGGIREIEFFVQTLQLLNAGRNPFLQTHATLEALQRLQRYALIQPDEAAFLTHTYRFYRSVENKLQMREEKQTHLLPDREADWQLLAQAMRAESATALKEKLQKARQRVQEIYRSLFAEQTRETEIQDWCVYLSSGEASEAIAEQIEQWFSVSPADALPCLQTFAEGARDRQLSREQVFLFYELAQQFDALLPNLAYPQPTLERINEFAQAYRAPRQFLKACNQQPQFFRALAALYDRSPFIYRLTCAHPEIIDEIFTAGLRLRKDPDVLRKELQALQAGDDRSLAAALWLYVRAEQVRIAIADVIAGHEAAATETRLTQLADAVLDFALSRIDPEGNLLIVALGKFGGEEIAFGSDLDIMLLTARHEGSAMAQRAAQRFLRLFAPQPQGGSSFEIDLRLRPHGQDGPLVTTLKAFQSYYEGPASTWERQMLVRSRPLIRRLSGKSANEQLQQGFVSMRDLYVYHTFQPEDIAAAEDMLSRIAQEKAQTDPPERSFKTARGGIVEIEFLCQTLQRRLGREDPSVRTPNTRRGLRSLTKVGALQPEDGITLLDNYNFLRGIELVLRRQENTPLAEIPPDPQGERALAHWLNFPEAAAFWREHTRRMAVNRQLCANYLHGQCAEDSPSGQNRANN